jgi:hypothetical protein
LDQAYIQKMEDVLAVYEKPYNPAHPVVCLDEKPISLHADVRPPISAKPGKLAKQDNEYQRCGTANVFGVVEPKGGRRFTTATRNRSGAEFARMVEQVVEQYPAADTIHLVMDNLNIQIVDRLLRRAEGRGSLGSARRALHAETRKLARSGRDRTQHVLAAMSGHAEDRREPYPIPRGVNARLPSPIMNPAARAWMTIRCWAERGAWSPPRNPPCDGFSDFT